MRGKLLILMLVAMLLLSGCGKTRTVTCDHCGKSVKVKEDSNVDDSWILYCAECELELFGEDGLIPED